jgi:hypothetical protein
MKALKTKPEHFTMSSILLLENIVKTNLAINITSTIIRACLHNTLKPILSEAATHCTHPIVGRDILTLAAGISSDQIILLNSGTVINVVESNGFANDFFLSQTVCSHGCSVG